MHTKHAFQCLQTLCKDYDGVLLVLQVEVLRIAMFLGPDLPARCMSARVTERLVSPSRHLLMPLTAAMTKATMSFILLLAMTSN